MIILDTLVIGGITFVLRRLAEAVEAEMNDVDTLREELLAAQMRRELGELSEEEFAAVERELLSRLREIRRQQADDTAGEMRVTAIDVSVADDLQAPPPEAPDSR